MKDMIIAVLLFMVLMQEQRDVQPRSRIFGAVYLRHAALRRVSTYHNAAHPDALFLSVVVSARPLYVVLNRIRQGISDAWADAHSLPLTIRRPA